MSVGGDCNRATISGLSSAHTYCFRIQAASKEGRSNYSAIGDDLVRYSPC